uniref:rRNA biogenesis protein RRP36 n=1 Tax=Stegastes partitus TaxID=144197 RepID=A0A3B5AY62_9TELE
MASSSNDEDSDVEKNFALVTERGGRPEEEEEEEEEHLGGEEGSDDDDGDDGEEDEGGSDKLSSMSFEDIMALQNKVGTKVYNQVTVLVGPHARWTFDRLLTAGVCVCDFRPMEISAKKPAPFLRQVVPVRKPTLRDPRFDDLSGEYKPEIFEKTYKFINDIRHREKEVREGLKSAENQERARKSREQQRERELQFRREQRERANQGAQPFFLKKSEKKKLQLAEKYQELKKSGKLDSFLSKKRKRNAGKDRRKLPKQSGCWY